MTREIKFRAWDKVEKRMWWNVESTYDTLHCHNIPEVPGKECDCVEHMFMPSSFGGVLANENLIVMQFTGLKDKTGKDIYEGDIIVHHIPSKGSQIGEVRIETSRGVTVGYIPLWFDPEVIGNVYQNPELLK